MPAGEALAALPEYLTRHLQQIDGHLIWTGGASVTNAGGHPYGRLMARRKAGGSVYVHRLVFEHLNDREPRRLTPSCGVELCSLHWSETLPGPRTIRKQQEILFLEEFVDFCEAKLKQLRRRRLSPTP